MTSIFLIWSQKIFCGSSHRVKLKYLIHLSLKGFMPISLPNSVNYVGECDDRGDYLCGECEGDCDSDSDCEGDLVCHRRSGEEAVPGCAGEGGDRDVYGKDICITKPVDPNPVVSFVGNPCTRYTGGLTCEECTGDCDRDSDCADDLRCAQRSGFSGRENVPGCPWGYGSDSIRFDNDDYCKYWELLVFIARCSRFQQRTDIIYFLGFRPVTLTGVVNYVGEYRFLISTWRELIIVEYLVQCYLHCC